MTPELESALQGKTASSPLRVIIADDERLARRKLHILLESEPEVQLVAECEDGRQTISAIHTLLPDLLLLDIQMPDLERFQVLNEVPPGEMPVVIFTSAHDQYAIRAFEAHALDYLLKPFDQERLHQAIERARIELLNSENREVTHRIMEMLSHIKAGAAGPSAEAQNRLVIKAKGRVIFLDMDDID